MPPAEQWDKVPESVRTFQMGPRPGQVPGQERRPGGRGQKAALAATAGCGHLSRRTPSKK